MSVTLGGDTFRTLRRRGLLPVGQRRTNDVYNGGTKGTKTSKKRIPISGSVAT